MRNAIGFMLGGLLVACGSSASSPPPGQDISSTPTDLGPAPSYSELFAKFFAPGKPGHCATAGCHADPGHNVWL